jgi:hypothetical protein
VKYLPLLLFLLASNSFGQTTPEEPTAPDVVLFPGPVMTRAARLPKLSRYLYFRGFPQNDFVARDFAIVGREVLEMVETFFNAGLAGPNEPIVCYPTSGQSGRTVRMKVKNKNYIAILIALNNDDLQQRNYCRFVYQFSHELGHYFYLPDRSNGLIETLADALQYRVLHDMQGFWKIQYADNPELVAYADRFPAYWKAKAAKRLSVLPEQDRHPASVADFLRRKLRVLDTDHNSPESLGIRMIAASAFPEDAPWPEFIGIAARTDPPPAKDATFREDLPTNLSGASPAMRRALRAIGRD